MMNSFHLTCTSVAAAFLGIFLSTRSAETAAYAKIAPAPGAKIGIVSILSPEITNVGGGVTVFSHYNNRLANNWQLDKFCFEKTRKLLEQAGYRAVDISLDDATLSGIRSGDDL